MSNAELTVAAVTEWACKTASAMSRSAVGGASSLAGAGVIGNPEHSIDPELMIRMLIVGYTHGIRSERQLCE